MKTKLIASLFVVVGLAVSSASAAINPAVWNAPTSTSVATGTFAGTSLTAVSTTSSPFLVGTLFNDRFAGSWDGSMPLAPTALALVTTNVNAGDSQAFSFGTAISDGLFYIENFDSNSMATITANGATSLSLIDNSASISYSSLGANTGTLVTSNGSFNGEGDAVLQFTGAVTSIQIQYSGGDGANGVMYTFAEPCATAVPEPTSAMVMAGLFGLGGTCVWFRRRKENK